MAASNLCSFWRLLQGDCLSREQFVGSALGIAILDSAHQSLSLGANAGHRIPLACLPGLDSTRDGCRNGGSVCKNGPLLNSSLARVKRLPPAAHLAAACPCDWRAAVWCMEQRGRCWHVGLSAEASQRCCWRFLSSRCAHLQQPQWPPPPPPPPPLLLPRCNEGSTT